MGNCELCGKVTEQLIKAKIEGVVMELCSNCAKHGTRMATPRNVPSHSSGFHRRTNTKNDTEEFISHSYAKDIKSKRESLNLKPEDLARKLNEKESLILKVESGNLKPSFPLAKKLESFLKIKLIETRSINKTHKRYEESQDDKEDGPTGRSNGLTFGDILKNAMKKK